MSPSTTAWGREQRLDTLRRAATLLAERGVLEALNPTHAAQTYGILVSEVDAELMRHLSEDCAK